MQTRLIKYPRNGKVERARRPKIAKLADPARVELREVAQARLREKSPVQISAVAFPDRPEMRVSLETI